MTQWEAKKQLKLFLELSLRMLFKLLRIFTAKRGCIHKITLCIQCIIYKKKVHWDNMDSIGIENNLYVAKQLI